MKPDGTQLGYIADTVGAEFGLVGEKYGWMVEIDPTRSALARKEAHLARPLPAREHRDPRRTRQQARLLHGRRPPRRPLVEVRFEGHHQATGRTRRTARCSKKARCSSRASRQTAPASGSRSCSTRPPNPNRPSDLVSNRSRYKAPPTATASNSRSVPRRRAGRCRRYTTVDGGFFGCTTVNETARSRRPLLRLPRHDARELLHVARRVAVRCVRRRQPRRRHALRAAGGLRGASAHEAVYLAHTDAAAGSDGYADSRIFTVAKYNAAINATQQSGDISGSTRTRPTAPGTTFTWTRFSKAGEVGTQPDGTAEPAPGMGYANVDNLIFDGWRICGASRT